MIWIHGGGFRRGDKPEENLFSNPITLIPNGCTTLRISAFPTVG